MPAPDPVRIAMWSGPRNISTALMRSFENRPDCAVVDEPFYGCYLRRSGADHPGREEIVAAMDGDWESVARSLTADVPDSCAVYYQKHMTHHLLPEVDLAFTDDLVNCFLLRDPARVILSYARVRPDFELTDLGFPQQLRIYEHVKQRTGHPPLVLHARHVLADPEGELRRLCDHAGIGFREEMLRWPPGPRESDGVWAPHWYASVQASTGFGPPPTDRPAVPKRYQRLHEQALAIYAEMQL
jgi:hypothetical protein